MNIQIPGTRELEKIYGQDAGAAAQRYAVLAAGFSAQFGAQELPAEKVRFFSAPGRTEIIGNHTDHNGGRILAASITMDTIAAAAPTGEDTVQIVSEGYAPVILDLKRLGEVPKCEGTLSLAAGMLEAAQTYGYRVGGFCAYITSQVIPSAGVSSSASFEMLLCAVLNELFNDGSMDLSHYARIGQYAENVWWKKSSGLMDQMACAAGGTIALDFGGGQVGCEHVDFGFDQIGMNLIILNTGKGHADLSAEYSAVPEEMRQAARACGGENLCDVEEETFLQNLPDLRKKLGNDRAVLRALHWYAECRRVDDAVRAIRSGEKERITALFRESGNSSWKWLQNCYVNTDPQEQPVCVALSLAESFLQRSGRGACRVHGGGFAGVIAAAVPFEETAEFVSFMTPYLGAENIYIMGIRQTGAVTV